MKLLGWLLLVGFLCAFWKALIVGVVVVAVVKAAPLAWRELQTERAQRRARADEMAARADLEDAWYVAGDPRGTYGRWAA